MVTRASHKARGATFETDTKDLFRSKGYESERLARTGAKDEGDVIVRRWLGREHVVIECKAPGKDGSINLSGWLREASVERGHYADARDLPSDTLGVVLIKARGKAIEDAYLVIRLGDLL
jgi:hypothetical protein